MSTIINPSDAACASAARDLFGGNGLTTNQQCELVAQLFADHRAKAEAGLRAENEVLLAEVKIHREADIELKDLLQRFTP